MASQYAHDEATDFLDVRMIRAAPIPNQLSQTSSSALTTAKTQKNSSKKKKLSLQPQPSTIAPPKGFDILSKRNMHHAIYHTVHHQQQQHTGMVNDDANGLTSVGNGGGGVKSPFSSSAPTATMSSTLFYKIATVDHARNVVLIHSGHSSSSSSSAEGENGTNNKTKNGRNDGGDNFFDQILRSDEKDQTQQWKSGSAAAGLKGNVPSSSSSDTAAFSALAGEGRRAQCFWDPQLYLKSEQERQYILQDRRRKVSLNQSGGGIHSPPPSSSASVSSSAVVGVIPVYAQDEGFITSVEFLTLPGFKSCSRDGEGGENIEIDHRHARVGGGSGVTTSPVPQSSQSTSSDGPSYEFAERLLLIGTSTGCVIIVSLSTGTNFNLPTPQQLAATSQQTDVFLSTFHLRSYQGDNSRTSGSRSKNKKDHHRFSSSSASSPSVSSSFSNYQPLKSNEKLIQNGVLCVLKFNDFWSQSGKLPIDDSKSFLMNHRYKMNFGGGGANNNNSIGKIVEDSLNEMMREATIAAAAANNNRVKRRKGTSPTDRNSPATPNEDGDNNEYPNPSFIRKFAVSSYTPAVRNNPSAFKSSNTAAYAPPPPTTTVAASSSSRSATANSSNSSSVSSSLKCLTVESVWICHSDGFAVHLPRSALIALTRGISEVTSWWGNNNAGLNNTNNFNNAPVSTTASSSTAPLLQQHVPIHKRPRLITHWDPRSTATPFAFAGIPSLDKNYRQGSGGNISAAGGNNQTSSPPDVSAYESSSVSASGLSFVKKITNAFTFKSGYTNISGDDAGSTIPTLIFDSASCVRCNDDAMYVLNPHAADEQCLVVVGASPNIATFSMQPVVTEVEVTTSKVVAEVASKVASAAMGFIRHSLWNRGGSSQKDSSAEKNKNKSDENSLDLLSKRRTIEPLNCRVESPLVSLGIGAPPSIENTVTFTSVDVDPTHRFAACYTPLGRIYIFDLLSGVLWRIIKNCRAAECSWLYPTINGRRTLLLAVHLNFRGVVEFYSLKRKRRAGAVKVGPNCTIFRGDALSVYESGTLLMLRHRDVTPEEGQPSHQEEDGDGSNDDSDDSWGGDGNFSSSSSSEGGAGGDHDDDDSDANTGPLTITIPEIVVFDLQMKKEKGLDALRDAHRNETAVKGGSGQKSSAQKFVSPMEKFKLFAEEFEKQIFEEEDSEKNPPYDPSVMAKSDSPSTSSPSPLDKVLADILDECLQHVDSPLDYLLLTMAMPVPLTSSDEVDRKKGGRNLCKNQQPQYRWPLHRYYAACAFIKKQLKERYQPAPNDDVVLNWPTEGIDGNDDAVTELLSPTVLLNHEAYTEDDDDNDDGKSDDKDDSRIHRRRRNRRLELMTRYVYVLLAYNSPQHITAAQIFNFLDLRILLLKVYVETAGRGSLKMREELAEMIRVTAALSANNQNAVGGRGSGGGKDLTSKYDFLLGNNHNGGGGGGGGRRIIGRGLGANDNFFDERFSSSAQFANANQSYQKEDKKIGAAGDGGGNPLLLASPLSSSPASSTNGPSPSSADTNAAFYASSLYGTSDYANNSRMGFVGSGGATPSGHQFRLRATPPPPTAAADGVVIATATATTSAAAGYLSSFFGGGASNSNKSDSSTTITSSSNAAATSADMAAAAAAGAVSVADSVGLIAMKMNMMWGSGAPAAAMGNALITGGYTAIGGTSSSSSSSSALTTAHHNHTSNTSFGNFLMGGNNASSQPSPSQNSTTVFKMNPQTLSLCTKLIATTTTTTTTHGTSTAENEKKDDDDDDDETNQYISAISLFDYLLCFWCGNYKISCVLGALVRRDDGTSSSSSAAAAKSPSSASFMSAGYQQPRDDGHDVSPDDDDEAAEKRKKKGEKEKAPLYLQRAHWHLKMKTSLANLFYSFTSYSNALVALAHLGISSQSAAELFCWWFVHDAAKSQHNTAFAVIAAIARQVTLGHIEHVIDSLPLFTVPTIGIMEETDDIDVKKRSASSSSSIIQKAFDHHHQSLSCAMVLLVLKATAAANEQQTRMLTTSTAAAEVSNNHRDGTNGNSKKNSHTASSSSANEQSSSSAMISLLASRIAVVYGLSANEYDRLVCGGCCGVGDNSSDESEVKEKKDNRFLSRVLGVLASPLRRQQNCYPLIMCVSGGSGANPSSPSSAISEQPLPLLAHYLQSRFDLYHKSSPSATASDDGDERQKKMGNLSATISKFLKFSLDKITSGHGRGGGRHRSSSSSSSASIIEELERVLAIPLEIDEEEGEGTTGTTGRQSAQKHSTDEYDPLHRLHLSLKAAASPLFPPAATLEEVMPSVDSNDQQHHAAGAVKNYALPRTAPYPFIGGDCGFDDDNDPSFHDDFSHAFSDVNRFDGFLPLNDLTLILMGVNPTASAASSFSLPATATSNTGGGSAVGDFVKLFSKTPPTALMGGGGNDNDSVTTVSASYNRSVVDGLFSSPSPIPPSVRPLYQAQCQFEVWFLCQRLLATVSDLVTTVAPSSSSPPSSNTATSYTPKFSLRMELLDEVLNVLLPLLAHAHSKAYVSLSQRIDADSSYGGGNGSDAASGSSGGKNGNYQYHQTTSSTPPASYLSSMMMGAGTTPSNPNTSSSSASDEERSRVAGHIFSCLLILASVLHCTSIVLGPLREAVATVCGPADPIKIELLQSIFGVSTSAAAGGPTTGNNASRKPTSRDIHHYLSLCKALAKFVGHTLAIDLLVGNNKSSAGIGGSVMITSLIPRVMKMDFSSTPSAAPSPSPPPSHSAAGATSQSLSPIELSDLLFKFIRWVVGPIQSQLRPFALHTKEQVKALRSLLYFIASHNNKNSNSNPNTRTSPSVDSSSPSQCLMDTMSDMYGIIAFTEALLEVDLTIGSENRGNTTTMSATARQVKSPTAAAPSSQQQQQQQQRHPSFLDNAVEWDNLFRPLALSLLEMEGQISTAATTHYVDPTAATPSSSMMSGISQRQHHQEQEQQVSITLINNRYDFLKVLANIVVTTNVITAAQRVQHEESQRREEESNSTHHHHHHHNSMRCTTTPSAATSAAGSLSSMPSIGGGSGTPPLPHPTATANASLAAVVGITPAVLSAAASVNEKQLSPLFDSLGLGRGDECRPRLNDNDNDETVRNCNNRGGRNALSSLRPQRPSTFASSSPILVDAQDLCLFTVYAKRGLFYIGGGGGGTDSSKTRTSSSAPSSHTRTTTMTTSSSSSEASELVHMLWDNCASSSRILRALCGLDVIRLWLANILHFLKRQIRRAVNVGDNSKRTRYSNMLSVLESRIPMALETWLSIGESEISSTNNKNGGGGGGDFSLHILNRKRLLMSTFVPSPNGSGGVLSSSSAVTVVKDHYLTQVFVPTATKTNNPSAATTMPPLHRNVTSVTNLWLSDALSALVMHHGATSAANASSSSSAMRPPHPPTTATTMAATAGDGGSNNNSKAVIIAASPIVNEPASYSTVNTSVTPAASTSSSADHDDKYQQQYHQQLTSLWNQVVSIGNKIAHDVDEIAQYLPSEHVERVFIFQSPASSASAASPQQQQQQQGCGGIEEVVINPRAVASALLPLWVEVSRLKL